MGRAWCLLLLFREDPMCLEHGGVFSKCGQLIPEQDVESLAELTVRQSQLSSTEMDLAYMDGPAKQIQMLSYCSKR